MGFRPFRGIVYYTPLIDKYFLQGEYGKKDLVSIEF